MLRIILALAAAGAAGVGVVEDQPAWTGEGWGFPGSTYGSLVSPAGDVNGDHWPDIAVADPGAGAIFIYHGGPAGFSAAPDATLVEGTITAAFGHVFCAAGDVNGDGFDDVIATASNAKGRDPYGALKPGFGAAFLYKGSITGLSPTPAWVAGGAWEGNYLGTSAICGDFNGDSLPDIAISACFAWTTAGGNASGVVQIWYGRASGNLPLLPGGTTAAPADLTLTGTQANAQFGGMLCCPGNLDGDPDGCDDLVVLAGGIPAGKGAGVAYAFHGSPAGLHAAPDGSSLGSGREVAWIAPAGDVNGDGFADLILQNGSKFLFLHRGSAIGMAEQSDPEFEATTGRGCGDVNEDGFDDVIVNGRYLGNFPNGVIGLHLGSPTGLSSTPSWIPLGGVTGANRFAVAAAGDVNRDGAADVIIGTNGLQAFVFHGRSGIPSVPTTLAQQVAATGEAIGQGGATRGIGVRLAVIVDDAQAEVMKIEVEVRPVGTPFSGVKTAESGTWVAALADASLVLGLLQEGTAYHWQVRARDASGFASPWTPFGSKPDDKDEADFVVTAAPAPELPPPGNDGGGRCQSSATGEGTVILLACIVLAARRRPTMLALVALAGCSSDPGGGGGAGSPGPAPTVEFSPSSLSIPVGSSAPLRFTLVHADGSREELEAWWSSVDPATASVDASGIVHGVAEGRTRVSATAIVDPSIGGKADILVTSGERVYGIDERLGLVRFPEEGGEREKVLAIADGAIYLEGIAVSGTFVYVLRAGPNPLWRYDVVADTFSADLRFSGGDHYIGLASDAQGRLYLAAPGHSVLRFDPANGNVVTVGALPEWVVGAIAVDAQGYVYVQDAMSAQVRRYPPTYVGSEIITSMNGFGLGLAVTTFGGPLYILDATSEKIYRCVDGDDDALYTSAGECLACSPVIPYPWGMAMKDGDLLVNDVSLVQGQLWRLRASGAAIEDPVLWSASGAVTGATGSNLAIWKP